MNTLPHVPTKSLTPTTPQAVAIDEPIASRKKVPHADVDQDGAQPSSGDRPEMETLGSAEATVDVAVSTGSETDAGAGSATATLNSSEDQSCKRDGQDGEDEDCNRAVAAWVTGGAALALLGGGAALASHGSDRPKANAAEPAPPVVIEPPVKQPLVVTFAAPPVSNHGTPALSGTAPAGSAVDLYEGSNKLGSTTADLEGKWSLTPTQPFGDGTHALTAKAKDAAGNEGSKDASVLIDTVAPAVSISSAAHTNDNTPEVTGTAPAGSQVDIYDGESKLGGTTSDEHGKWSFSPTQALADGNHTLVAKVKDDAGNEGTAHATVDIDTVTPTVTITVNPLTNDNTPDVSGTAPAGSLVDVYEGTTKLGSGTADAAGNWTFTPTTSLADGTHTLTATTKDAVGNEGTGTSTVNIDTVAPTVTLSAPSLTNDNTPAVSGMAPAGGLVDVYEGTTKLGSGMADAAGHWSFSPTQALADGTHTLTVKTQDAAGNEGTATSAVDIDTVAPQAPSFTTPNGSDWMKDGILKLDHLEAGATLTVLVNGQQVVPSHLGMDLSYDQLKEGSNSIYAYQTDAAGNVSQNSNRQAVLDKTNPANVTVQTSFGFNNVLDSPAESLVFKGKEFGATIFYRIDDGAWQETTVTTLKGSEFADVTGPADRTLSFYQVDSAGNASGAPSNWHVYTNFPPAAGV